MPCANKRFCYRCLHRPPIRAIKARSAFFCGFSAASTSEWIPDLHRLETCTARRTKSVGKPFKGLLALYPFKLSKSGYSSSEQTHHLRNHPRLRGNYYHTAFLIFHSFFPVQGIIFVEVKIQAKMKKSPIVTGLFVVSLVLALIQISCEL